MKIAPNNTSTLVTSSLPPHGYFITGTDTEVGKTYLSVAIIKALVRRGVHVGAYKPAVSGLSDGMPCDPDLLAAACGASESAELYCPQRFAAPLAPPMAAAAEGRSIDEDLLTYGATLWHNRCDSLVVEGAGGWQSPISTQFTNADIAQRLGYPVILIAANKLGVVNHVLLTLESIRNAGLSTKLILLNDCLNQPDRSVQSNLDLLTRFVSARFGPITIGTVGYRGEVAETLIDPLVRP